jgi:ceramide glucosyltransferase
MHLIIPGTIGLLVAIGIAYLIAAERAVARFAALGFATAGDRPPVCVFKPLYGAEPGLEANLATFLTQDYPKYQVIFGLHSPDDPARLVVEKLVAAHPSVDISVVVNTARHGTNGKISNLINMSAVIGDDVTKQEVIVLADSDMAVGPDYLAHLADELAGPDVGAVTCLYLGRPQPGLPSLFGAAFINHHFLPQVMIARALGNDEGCFGATIALKRDVLDRIGGFAALKDILADDHEIGRRVRALGLRVKLSRVLADDTVNEPDWKSLFAHELRWCRTIRLANPAGFAASVITLPVAIATLAVMLSAADTWAIMLLGLAFGARIWFQRRLDRLLGLASAPFWLPLLRDGLTFAMVVTSFLGRRVHWRGADFQVTPDGSLIVEKDAEP